MTDVVKKPYQKYLDILWIIIGTFLVALGFNAFLLPNRFVSGGLNGLTIILFQLFNWSPSIVLFSVNFILLGLAYLLLGKEKTLKSVLGSLLVPSFVSLLSGISFPVVEPILAAIFGGAMIGLGVGLVFLGNGTTGGTGLMALILQKYIPLKIGVLLGICDGLVIFTALFVFDIQSVLFALVSLFITTRVIDTVKVGPNFSKNVFIISEKYPLIREMIISDLDRGVTLLPIEGGLNLEEKKMIMTVVPDNQFLDLKEKVLEIDAEAFMVIGQSHEVLGKGFTLLKQ